MLKDSDTERRIVGSADGVAKVGGNTESLKVRAKRWSAAVKDRATGPLVVAREIVEVVDRWEHYQQQAEGKSAAQWLKVVFGKHHKMGPAYWRRRARAVDLLGESCRRTVHHEVAVWITHKVSGEDLAKARKALIAGCRRNGGIPLNMSAAKPIIYDLFGWVPQVTTCKRCEFLEALLKEHGIAVPEE